MNEDQSNEKPKEEYVNFEIPEPQLSGHMWMQLGTQLICQSCPFAHSTFIQPGYQLYGIDDNGQPMIRALISGRT